jgi:hypothetical protein
VGLLVGFVVGVHWTTTEPALLWTVQFDGYGQVRTGDGWLSLSPRPSVEPTETHAALVVAGDPSWRDYQFQVRMRLERQLRHNSSPNPWEVGWLFFRYQAPDTSYYLAHKTNGLELGKLVPASTGTTQVFLVTTEEPAVELGRWYQYRVLLERSTISVYVDGVLHIKYKDPDPIESGRVGVYAEDAHTSAEHPAVKLANW